MSDRNTRDDARQTACPIAIIGMGCLFPGARNLVEFWRMIRDGRDGIGDVPETHWSADDYYDPDPKAPDMTYCRRGGFLSPTDFDPTEFGIPPAILEATDTTQLLSLIVAKAALQDAGYGENREFNRDRVSVLLGITGTQELVLPLAARLGHPLWRRALAEAGVESTVAEDVVQRIADGHVSWQENSFPGLLGNVVAGRIANRLNLLGTNCAVDAACASSLSAIHLAMMELQTGRCEMALAGGADTLNDIFMYMCFSKTPALSPTGDARPFSRDADGTVLGEGVGLIVLKRLADAERDGDRIYAVLKGMGTSSDGRSQSIYAPHAAGQARALRAAYREAGFSTDTIELVEGHGTGTKVGDATEFEALSNVFRDAKRDGAWCALGSVKSQIGHTKAAAGVAGLIKAALAIHHKTLPPTIKVDAPNPKLAVDDSPFYLSTESRPWLPADGRPRRAGVSAFGFGGSNFHAALEEHRAALPEVAWDGSVQIIAFSAETIGGVRSQVRDWCEAVGESPGALERLAYHAAKSREAFSRDRAHRLLIVLGPDADWRRLLAEAETRLDASSGEESWALPNVFYGGGDAPGGLALLLPGQGSQYVNMGRHLACTFPEVLDAFAEAEGAADSKEARLVDLVYPRPTFDDSLRASQAEAITRTDVAQPALGALGLGMFRVLQRFGVRPDVTAGHSYGELVALCAAGRFSADTLHRLSRLRGRLMANGDGDRGAMLVVKAPVADIERMLTEENLDLVIANRNGPEQNVLSGEREAIGRAAAACKRRGIAAKALKVSGAFHSSLMDAALGPFRNALEAVAFDAGGATVFANTTGRAYPADPAETRKLLAEQLIRPVDFVGEVVNLYDTGVRTFVEVGPRAVLTGLVAGILKDRPHAVWAMDASAGRRSAMVDLALLLAKLAARGHSVDLSRWERRVDEPRKPRMVVPLVGANYRAAPSSAAGKTPARPVVAQAATELWHRRPAGETTGETPVPQSGETTGETAAPQSGETTGETAVPQLPSSAENMFDNSGATIPAGGSKPVTDPVHQDDGAAPKDARRESEPAAPERASHGVPCGASPGANPPTASPPSGALSDAMRLVQHGLDAMQRLQQQTAEAHERFLEGQEQAHRSLQQLLEQQRRVFPAQQSVAPPAPTPTHLQTVIETVPPPSPTLPLPERAATPPAVEPARAAEPVSPQPATPAPVRVAQDAARDPVPNSAGSGLGRDAIETQVVSVVCEKTGYPAEMVDLDMDIEADLGVDSIKRVEIIAALEERISGFEGVSPEYMGDIRKLSQIVDFIATAVGSSDVAGAAPDGIGAPASDSSATTAATSTGLASDGSAIGVEAFSAALLEVVAELTGYPAEMLDLEMDMEADLGIDSIKRVEILAAVESRMPDLPSVQPEYMGSLRTLNQIVEYCTGQKPSGSSTSAAAPPAPEADSSHQPAAQATAETREPPVELNRRVLGLVDLRDAAPGELPVAPGHAILVTDDGGDLSVEIVTRLESAGCPAHLIPAAGPRKTVDHPVGGLIFVAPRRVCDGLLGDEDTDAMHRQAFALTQSLAGALRSAGDMGGALLVTVSRMDGGFGLVGGAFDAAQGGLAGLTKTAEREWENVTCRALDVSRDWGDSKAAAAAIVAELRAGGPVEVGLDAGARRGLDLTPARITEGQPAISAGDVVVVTGGARGVTAAAALALARRYRITLVLLGRTTVSEREPPWLAGVETDREIKAAVAEHAPAFTGGRPAPIELERAFRRIVAAREVRRNLDRMTEAGAQVVYCSVDVCDGAAVRTELDALTARLGPVRGLIHGAGMIEDRRIIDKTPEQFAAVYDTKVRGLRSIFGAVTPSDLRHIVLFSSVSGRCGNAGQVDYAVANEVLNKCAQRLAAKLPGCRTVSLNFGPWDGGMVGPGLKREFDRQGVALIPLTAGGEAVADELSNAADGAVEIVLGSAFDDGAKAAAPPVQRSATPKAADAAAMSLAFERMLDIDSHPFLRSHVLDGRAVLPVAVAMEWLAHAATHANPGLCLQGLDDLRVLKGVVLDGASVPLRFYAAAPRRSGDVFDVDVELRSLRADGAEVPHVRATVVLTTRPAEAPVFTTPPDLVERRYDRGVAGAYADVLFHGEAFRAIERVDGYSSAGMVAGVRTRPSPGDWMTEPLRSDWLTDPLAIDAAFQIAILWCREMLDAVSLPVGFGSYRQYTTAFPVDGVSVVLQVRAQSSRAMMADVTFVARDGAVVARIEGYECVADAALCEAFGRDRLQDAAS